MTNNRKVRKTISAVVEKLKVAYRPEKIFLFGSFAYGKPNRDSDIDLLIIKNTKKRPIDRRIMARSLIYDLREGFPFSFLVITPKEVNKRLERGDQFLQEIISRGEVLYAKQ